MKFGVKFNGKFGGKFGVNPEIFTGNFRPFAHALTLVSALLVFGMFSAAAARAAEPGIDAQIAQAERERKEYEQKLDKYRETIRRMKVQENSLLVRIDEKRQETERARQEVSLLELQVRKLQDSISALNMEMARLAAQIEDIRARLRRRLIDASKYGDSEALLLIMSAESTHEMLDSVHLLEKLSQYDQSLIEQLQSRGWEMDLSRKTMEDSRARLERRMRDLGLERQKFTAAIKETNSVLENIRRQKATAEKAAKEMEEAQRAVGQTILELMRQRKERDEAAKRAGKGQGSVDYLAGRIAQGRGSMFDWPVRGKISSPFGTRVHPVFKTKSFHSGMDIASPQGTPVKAAAPGEVLFEGWMRGYGRVVIIDHGRDYSTVYAHMSSARVREGAIVQAGTVIGTVGDTGTTTGFHLHFEVRVGSTAKNPLDYLKR